MSFTEPQATSVTSRQELARQQATLIEALKCGQALPPGFSHQQISIAAKSLAHKRAAGIRKAMPSLAEALGDSFSGHLAAFTQSRPSPAPEGPRADAIAFSLWLQDRELLPDACFLEMQVATASCRWPMKLVRLPKRKKLALVLRIPGLRVRVFALPHLLRSSIEHHADQDH